MDFLFVKLPQSTIDELPVVLCCSSLTASFPVICSFVVQDYVESEFEKMTPKHFQYIYVYVHRQLVEHDISKASLGRHLVFKLGQKLGERQNFPMMQ